MPEIETFSMLCNALERSNIVVLGLDPGETTGVAVLRGPQVLLYTQVPTKSMAVGGITVDGLVGQYQPGVIVVEDYRIYKWKKDDHTWASLHTPRLLGVIEYVSHLRSTPLVFQMAQLAKGFCTDAILRGLDLYNTGAPHGRDAMRHALWYTLFKICNIQVQPAATSVEGVIADAAATIAGSARSERKTGRR